jgi:hypothetical protein
MVLFAGEGLAEKLWVKAHPGAVRDVTYDLRHALVHLTCFPFLRRLECNIIRMMRKTCVCCVTYVSHLRASIRAFYRNSIWPSHSGTQSFVVVRTSMYTLRSSTGKSHAMMLTRVTDPEVHG